MPNKLFWILVTIVSILSTPRFGYTSSPLFWRVSTQGDFLSGEAKNISIDSDGQLLLGIETETIYESDAPFIWSIIALSDGSLVAGTGNDGKVLRIKPGGNSEILFDSDELEVHALALANDGDIYVATSPDGQIYKVGLNGSIEKFFDPDDKYIWSLIVDTDGNLFAGTGESGIIYKIKPNGEGSIFYKTKTAHVTTLAFDFDKNLLAGSDSPGQVFRIDDEGKAFILLHTPFVEIHALNVTSEGTIYATAVSKRHVSGQSSQTIAAQTRAPIASVSTEITGMAVGEMSSTLSSNIPNARGALQSKGAVYRIFPDGLWDTLWETKEDVPYDLILDNEDRLIVGTGNTGKIFQINTEPRTSFLLGKAAAKQITRFVNGADGTYYATANPGKIFKLSSSSSMQGTYDSVIKDAGTVATWGTLRWNGNQPSGSDIVFYTRSGNTAIADDTWSDWIPSQSTGENTTGKEQQIQSPKSRYLQWRTVLKTKQSSPVLTSVTVAYLERNLSPTISPITIQSPGTVFQKPFSSNQQEIAGYDKTRSNSLEDEFSSTVGSASQPTSGRSFYRKGLQTFTWQASDPNNDNVRFDVFYRPENKTGWIPLRDGLTNSILTWDTSSAPDGSYIIRIVASDALSNSPETALTAHRESSVFDVDNSPPSITITGVNNSASGIVTRFTVRDAHSPVQRVEYATDTGAWQIIYPIDGIPDSQFENFEITIGNETSSGQVTIRATDALNNVSTAVSEPNIKSQ